MCASVYCDASFRCWLMWPHQQATWQIKYQIVIIINVLSFCHWWCLFDRFFGLWFASFYCPQKHRYWCLAWHSVIWTVRHQSVVFYWSLHLYLWRILCVRAVWRWLRLTSLFISRREIIICLVMEEWFFGSVHAFYSQSYILLYSFYPGLRADNAFHCRVGFILTYIKLH